ncbi:hypothetical protein Trydic_g23541 [Trypoxylus dichotomus]
MHFFKSVSILLFTIYLNSSYANNDTTPQTEYPEGNDPISEPVRPPPRAVDPNLIPLNPPFRNDTTPESVPPPPWGAAASRASASNDENCNSESKKRHDALTPPQDEGMETSESPNPTETDASV